VFETQRPKVARRNRKRTATSGITMRVPPEAKAIGFDIADSEGITLTALFLGLLADRCRKQGLQPTWENHEGVAA
jgi:hypothetical protein